MSALRSFFEFLFSVEDGVGMRQCGAMKEFVFFSCFLLFTASARAQIYADVSVSHDGNALGVFRIDLHHETAPRTVANFVGLATGERAWVDPETGAVMEDTPYYDGLLFHRLIHSFVIQGGDPLGTGGGGPGYVFQDEFNPSLRHDGRYVVSMANSGVNSNGSQFFITLAAAGNLDDLHSVFGTVIDDATHPNGRAIIDGFTSTTNFPTDAADRPLAPIVIESVVVSGPDLAGFDIDDPALGLPAVERRWMRLESREEGDFLIWNGKDRVEGPLRFSGDLQGWSLGGYVLTMGGESEVEVEVTALVGPGTTFFSFPAVDYSHTPDLPPNIFQAGDAVALETGGGTLTVTFDGAGGGTWLFEENGGRNHLGQSGQFFFPR